MRWSFAGNICGLCEAFGEEITQKELVVAFEKLLRDSEKEVRISAAFKATDVAKVLPQYISNVLLPWYIVIITVGITLLPPVHY